MMGGDIAGSPVICTIGYTKKSLRRFMQLLQDAGVERVVDIRRNNTSQLAGFSKKDDLDYILSLVGIEYEHIIDLSPSEKLLTRYHKDHDWMTFEADFRREEKKVDCFNWPSASPAPGRDYVFSARKIAPITAIAV